MEQGAGALQGAAFSQAAGFPRFKQGSERVSGPGEETRMWPRSQGAGGSRSERPGTETEKLCLKGNAEKGHLRTNWVNWPRARGKVGWGQSECQFLLSPALIPCSWATWQEGDPGHMGP